MSRGAPQHLGAAAKNNAIPWVTILATAIYSAAPNRGCSHHFRRKSAAFRQEIRSVFHSHSTFDPQIFLGFSA
jgi:hypothetical protein